MLNYAKFIDGSCAKHQKKIEQLDRRANVNAW